LWWGGNHCYFEGEILSISDNNRARIKYDDGQYKSHAMWLETFDFLDTWSASYSDLFNAFKLLDLNRSGYIAVDEVSK